MLAEACLLYGWVPKDALEMPANLFFAMLSKGRQVDRRKRFKAYHELCRVALYPHLVEASQKDVAQYFFENSLSPLEIDARNRFRKEAEAKAAENYVSTKQLVEMLNGRAR